MQCGRSNLGLHPGRTTEDSNQGGLQGIAAKQKCFALESTNIENGSKLGLPVDDLLLRLALLPLDEVLIGADAIADHSHGDFDPLQLLTLRGIVFYSEDSFTGLIGQDLNDPFCDALEPACVG